MCSHGLVKQFIFLKFGSFLEWNLLGMLLLFPSTRILIFVCLFWDYTKTRFIPGFALRDHHS